MNHGILHDCTDSRYFADCFVTVLEFEPIVCIVIYRESNCLSYISDWLMLKVEPEYQLDNVIDSSSVVLIEPNTNLSTF